MNFMQPWMLIALPLVLIPIIIHLVNQRRFQTVPWAAMRFLLEASKMSSGYTKLRQWLILAMRTLALLALVVRRSRYSGWRTGRGRAISAVLLCEVTTSRPRSRHMGPLAAEGDVADRRS